MTTGLLVAAVATVLLAIKAPELHAKWLRKKVGDKVVYMLREDRGGGGTGFEVKAKSGKTFILTNNHVCLMAKNGMVDVTTQDMQDPLQKTTKVKIVDRLKDHDLCLTEASPDADGIEIGEPLKRGDSVYLIGHPLLNPTSFQRGEYIGDNRIQLFFGTNLPKELCIGLNYDIEKVPMHPLERMLLQYVGIQTICIADLKANMINVISYPGNSGSPVVTGDGKLVGVLFAGNPAANTDTYMVPLDKVKELLDRN